MGWWGGAHPYQRLHLRIIDSYGHFHFQNTSVTILSDSKSAVDWINDDHFGSLEHVDWLNDIRNFLMSLNGLRIAFSPRGLNSFADGLAKLGASASGECVDWVVI